VGTLSRTAESVTRGHPDKICDQISDAILDEYLKQDPYSRVACESAISGSQVWIFGEVASRAKVDHEAVARSVLSSIGYTAESGIDPMKCSITSSIKEQSPDIAMGVVEGAEMGAGDQGIMYGYATDETDALMPLPIYAAKKLTRALSMALMDGSVDGLRPDGKSQITVNDAGLIDTVVLSAQHDAGVDLSAFRGQLYGLAQSELAGMVTPNATFLINQTGRFVLGGPAADAGLTGRKIIVDTYGGEAHHGGGAFSGKDPTKVDRSAAYAARNAAKNVVANGLARKVEITVAYAIGMARPVSLSVDAYGTGDNETIRKYIIERWDFRPAAIIERFDLRKPWYYTAAVQGHFGVDGLPWESVEG
jgi:S-adenosylmethionine synthetase